MLDTTESDKKYRTRVIIFCLLTLLSVLVWAFWVYIALQYAPTDVFWAVASIMLPLVYYVYLYNKLFYQLTLKAFESLGFQPIPTAEAMQNYEVRKLGQFNVMEAYQDSVQEIDFKIFKFSITRGSGKNKQTFYWAGIEFETNKDHVPVQIYDKRNYIRPFFKRDRQLESSEFNKNFVVNSPDPQNPFYFLDPDTMHEITELRKELKFGINIESSDNKILIYTKSNVLTGKLSQLLSIADVFHQRLNDDKVQQYKESIVNYISVLSRIYKALDYKLKLMV